MPGAGAITKHGVLDSRPSRPISRNHVEGCVALYLRSPRRADRQVGEATIPTLPGCAPYGWSVNPSASWIACSRASWQTLLTLISIPRSRRA